MIGLLFRLFSTFFLFSLKVFWLFGFWMLMKSSFGAAENIPLEVLQAVKLGDGISTTIQQIE